MLAVERERSLEPVAQTNPRLPPQPLPELRVVGVRVELPGNQPILLLKETQGERYLPIWIGAVEAAAIETCGAVRSRTTPSQLGSDRFALSALAL